MATKQTFQDALNDPTAFSITWELVPGRGAREKSQENVLKMAELAANDKRIHGITITDNPGGRPAILASSLAIETMDYGIEPIIHFTSKDKNRSDLESEIYAMARSGVKNLLVMSGDFPVEGYEGKPKPVFDMDSVQTLRLIEEMNVGRDIPSYRGKIKLQKTNFYTGAVVSPFKQTEAGLMTQYYKLHKKAVSGANFIITQLGYDARKFDELKKYIELKQLNLKLIGNIYVLSTGVARLMNENKIPGCVVTEQLLRDIEIETEKNDNNKERQLSRAAKLYAVLKGLGYDGVNLSGHGLDYNDIVYIIEQGEVFSEEWPKYIKDFNYPQEDGFYYFKKDKKTGLNSSIPLNREGTESGQRSISYYFFELVHRAFFDKKAPFYSLSKTLAEKIDEGCWKKPFTYLEHKVKSISNDCQYCGDCTLHKTAFLCPMSKCPKEQRNGPCGGTHEGWCEVYPGEMKCIYVKAYQRLKNQHQEESLRKGYIPPCNWELYKTSSWLNYFAGRDFTGKKE